MTSTSPTRLRSIASAPHVAARPSEARGAGVGGEPITEGAARTLGALGVLVIALIHILDAAGTYESTRWIFWAYMTLVVSAIPVALLLLHASSSRAWVAAGAVAAGPLAGYLWSRTLGLPGDAGDVGNWLCTLGMVSLFVEATVLGLSLTRLSIGR